MARKFFRRRFYLPCLAAERGWLSSYLDGELDARRRAQVAQHAAKCARCRTELEDLSFAARAVAYFQIPEPDAQTESEMLSVLRDRLKSSPERDQSHPFGSIARAHRNGFAATIESIWASSISLPTPLAIAALIIVFAASFYAARLVAPRTSAAPVVINAQPRIVEVPVERETARERIITRTVYIERTRAASKHEKQSPNFNQSNQPRNAMQQTNGISLAGFRPATDANLRIVNQPEQ